MNLLLDAGANVNEPSLEGFRPLHWAVSGVNDETRAQTVKLLLDRGAYVNTRTDKGFTALQRAVQAGDADLVRVLVAHHHRNTSGSSPAPMSQCTCINADGPFSMSAIHSAVFANRGDIIQLLLEAGADTEVRTHKAWTPLHVAARFGYVESKVVLLQGGANPEAVTSRGLTPADVAKKWSKQW